MRGNYLLLIIVGLLFLLCLACGGKSNVTGEVVTIENVCAYERAKAAATDMPAVERETKKCLRKL